MKRNANCYVVQFLQYAPTPLVARKALRDDHIDLLFAKELVEQLRQRENGDSASPVFRCEVPSAIAVALIADFKVRVVHMSDDNLVSHNRGTSTEYPASFGSTEEQSHPTFDRVMP